MEKREETLYIKSKGSIKAYWLKRMKVDGFNNLSAWFEEFTLAQMKKDKRRKK